MRGPLGRRYSQHKTSNAQSHRRTENVEEPFDLIANVGVIFRLQSETHGYRTRECLGQLLRL